jgi:hypothetical protein
MESDRRLDQGSKGFLVAGRNRQATQSLAASRAATGVQGSLREVEMNDCGPWHCDRKT